MVNRCIPGSAPTATPRKARAPGFTLIELMIVVAVVAVLAGLALPAYLEQVRKAQRTVAKTALLELAQAEERYFTVNQSYTSDLGELGLPDVTEQDYFNIAITAAGVNGYTLRATPYQTRDIYSLRLDSLGTKSHRKAGVSDWSAGWP